MTLSGIGTPEHELFNGQVLKDLGNNEYQVSVQHMGKGGEWSFCMEVPSGTPMSTSDEICAAIDQYMGSSVNGVIGDMSKSTSSNTAVASSANWQRFDNPLGHSEGEI